MAWLVFLVQFIDGIITNFHCSKNTETSHFVSYNQMSMTEPTFIMLRDLFVGKGQFDMKDLDQVMTVMSKRCDNSEESLRDAFSVFDRDGSGYIRLVVP